MPNRLSRIKIRQEEASSGAPNGKKKYFCNIEYPLIGVNSNDIYIISKIGDRLDLLANDFYGDTKYWWIISRANPDKIRQDSFFIDPGLQIRIPSDVVTPYSIFNEINK